MITEDYVSFELAKLLKEKGFDGECWDAYTGNNWTYEPPFKNSEFNLDAEKSFFTIPTIQMAMKWLREVHSLYIDIVTSFSQDGICYTFSCSNTMDLIQGTKGTSYHEYQTYEEACEEAIKYCLENLI